MRREVEHLGLELPGAVQRRAAGHGGRPAAAGQPERDDVGVADDDAHLLEWHAELVRGDLGESRLVALAVRHLAGEQHDDAVLVEPEPHELRCPSGRCPPVERGPGAASMNVAMPMPRYRPCARASACRRRNAGRSTSSATRSSDSLVVTPASGRPVIMTAGGSVRAATLRSRISSGSRPRVLRDEVEDALPHECLGRPRAAVGDVRWPCWS